jgi:hypothetical protein
VTPLIWRVGRTLGRTLYRGDVCVGMVNIPSIAEEIVAAMNGTPTLQWWGIQDVVGGRWWPRRFRSFQEAEDHLANCRDPVPGARVARIEQDDGGGFELDEELPDATEGSEAVRRLGIDVKSWSASIKDRVAKAGADAPSVKVLDAAANRKREY